MKEIRFETIFTAEEISDRINKLIDSESIFDSDRAIKPFSGYCNVCKFDMTYPNKAYKNDLVPKYSIHGTITSKSNLREVYLLIRKPISSYIGPLFILILYIIGILKGFKIILVKLTFLLIGLIGYYISIKNDNKRDIKTEQFISEQILKTIFN